MGLFNEGPSESSVLHAIRLLTISNTPNTVIRKLLLLPLLASLPLHGVMMGPDYTVTATQDIVDFLGPSPYVHQTASADANYVVNTTPGSVAGGYGLPDPQIPPLPQHGLRITDTSVTDPKTKIVAIGGVHAREQSGSHMLDGFLRKLVDGSPGMIDLLGRAEFFIYPQVNPEGRYGYNQPGNPHGIERDAPSNLGAGDFDEDLNRMWDDPTGWPQIVAIQAVMKADTESSVDIYFDFHARSFTRQELANKNPSEGPKQIWVPQHLLNSEFIRALLAQDPEIEIHPSSTGTGYMSSREWAMSDLGLNSVEGYTPECARDEPAAFYQDLGATYALALYNLLKPAPPPPQPVPDKEGASLLLDFNDADVPGGQWTTIEALATNQSVAFPAGGITGPFGVRVDGDWNNTSSTTGQASALLAEPDLADGATDYLYISGENEQGTVILTNLSPTLSYKIEVVASRSSPGSIPKTADYTVNNSPADSDSDSSNFDVFADGFTNGDVLAWNSVRPDSLGRIVFRAVSDAGAGSNGSNAYVNAMRVTEVLVYEQWLEHYPQLSGSNREGWADPDGDGWDNESEMLLGTHPLNSLSSHQLLFASQDSLSTITQPGRYYSIEKTSTLSDPDSWTELGKWGPGDGSTLQFPIEFTPGFYRSGVYLVP